MGWGCPVFYVDKTLLWGWGRSRGKNDEEVVAEIDSLDIKSTGVSKTLLQNGTRKIARLASWDFQRNYVVHQVYHAEDFAFLASAAKNSSVTFKGSGEAVRNFIEAGISADLIRTGSQNLSIEVTDKAGGAVVMRLFRIKRNGGIY